MSAEDSGNYTCEIRGPLSVTLSSVTHQLYVRGTCLRVSVVLDIVIINSAVPKTNNNACNLPAAKAEVNRKPNFIQSVHGALKKYPHL